MRDITQHLLKENDTLWKPFIDYFKAVFNLLYIEDAGRNFLTAAHLIFLLVFPIVLLDCSVVVCVYIYLLFVLDLNVLCSKIPTKRVCKNTRKICFSGSYCETNPFEDDLLIVAPLHK